MIAPFFFFTITLADGNGQISHASKIITRYSTVVSYDWRKI